MKTKTLLLSLLCIVGITTATAQSNVWCWKDGKPFRMQEIDIITFVPHLVQVVNGYEATDLGLSVKWASCNVGASKPEEFGDYFAWGETWSKDVYSWKKYTLSNDEGDWFTKYNNSQTWHYGYFDGLGVLEAEDDAASVAWGEPWRMPTKEELTELYEKCTWAWKGNGNPQYNGVAGYEVRGPNGNSIFLPAAGWYDETAIGMGESGSYWSASLDEVPSVATVVNFDNAAVEVFFDFRYMGKSVRAVLSE